MIKSKEESNHNRQSEPTRTNQQNNDDQDYRYH